MLDNLAIQEWRTTKESYPKAIVFAASNEMFVVRGEDAAVIKRRFSIEGGSPWLAFDSIEARVMMHTLAAGGISVVLVSNGKVHEWHPPKKVEKLTTVLSSFLAIEPRLLFDQRDLRAPIASQDLLHNFRDWLKYSESKKLREYGQIFIYRVGDWYEVEAALTTMLPKHLMLLAQAACDTGCKLPCQLVAPRTRRLSKYPSRQSRLASSQTAVTYPLGQLTFDSQRDL